MRWAVAKFRLTSRVRLSRHPCTNSPTAQGGKFGPFAGRLAAIGRGSPAMTFIGTTLAPSTMTVGKPQTALAVLSGRQSCAIANRGGTDMTRHALWQPIKRNCRGRPVTRVTQFRLGHAFPRARTHLPRVHCSQSVCLGITNAVRALSLVSASRQTASESSGSCPGKWGLSIWWFPPALTARLHPPAEPGLAAGRVSHWW
jgi:hypothetical protein